MLVWLMGDVESVTVKIWLVVPSVSIRGMPLIVPDETTLNCNPFGNAGFNDHV